MKIRYEIDTREPTWVRDLLREQHATVRYLEAGDIRATREDGHVVLIERKEPGDFLQTAREDRLYPEIARMLSETAWSYVVIPGWWRVGPSGKIVVNGQESGWLYAAVAGYVLTLEEMGAHVVHCISDADFERTVINIASRDHRPVVLRSLRPAEKLDPQAELLCGIHGMGPAQARAALKVCGSAANVFAALSDKKHIPGVTAPIGPSARVSLGLQPGKIIRIVDDPF
jgi:ERCC4-type nuclease